MNLEIVNQELNSTEFVLKTQRQIIKDFGTAGVDFVDDFHSIPFAVERVISMVSMKLKEVQEMGSNSLSQLLYQIDIPESILADLAQSDDFYLSLAEVVLKREAYKVYLRSKFSS